MEEANLSPTEVKGKIVVTNLEEAILCEANLHGADLKDTNLNGANLEEADLHCVKNLTIEQLSKVKTLYKAKLDPELREQIEKDYPHLLKEPKESTS